MADLGGLWPPASPILHFIRPLIKVHQMCALNLDQYKNGRIVNDNSSAVIHNDFKNIAKDHLQYFNKPTS